MNFRFILVWAVLTLLFAAVYTYVPDVKLKFKEQIPGQYSRLWCGASFPGAFPSM